MKVTVTCAWCGKEFQKYISKVKRFNFCSRECMWHFQSKTDNPDGYMKMTDFTKQGQHFHEMNKIWNKTRMTPEVREKLRQSRLKDDSTYYRKINGMHEHRAVAEYILGRKLASNEIVHHIDRNKRNNRPSNLIVMTQAEHARLHKLCEGKREVITDAFQAARLSAVLH